MENELQKKSYMKFITHACEVSIDCLESVREYGSKHNISHPKLTEVKEKYLSRIDDYMENHPDCKTKIQAISEMSFPSWGLVKNETDLMIMVACLSKDDLLEHKKIYN